ncbi:YbfB/YjiJ family MFS transporter [Solimicrobium silvestre]|uniref:Uncharacterized protein n=1 Tax=Solimicrobium silvestre TaxID=2099400 RepID=A0A2S9GUC9_9BURK|nr:YbfB/YjiJ family MFS transporter [Solimicrobium silvestre]PRC91342.1 hypothetical protein S2091_3887 [Solimicrobium silvestre]
MSQNSNHRQAWQIALCGILAIGVAQGIGRFAFSPLLPMMLHDKLVNLTQGGWLATANYIGYFIGALLCMVFHKHPTRFIRIGLVATTVFTLWMSFSSQLWCLLLLRALAGIASALVFVFTSGWCMQRLTQLGFPTLGGIIYTGPGLGILITGIPVTFMVAADWSAQRGWLVFGVMALLLSAVIWPIFSEHLSINTDTNSSIKPRHLHAAKLSAEQLKHQTRWLIFGYGLAGFGYIITATFLPVMARIALPNSVWPDLFWPMLGASIAIGAALTTRVPMHIDNRSMLMLCYITQATGVLFVILLPNVLGFILSSIFVGLPFSAIVFFVMRDARRLRGDAANRLMGLLTAIYGIGQISGPPLATHLVTLTGSFTASLFVAAGALTVGAVLFGILARSKFE